MHCYYSPVLRHGLRGDLHRIVRGDRDGIPRHDVPYLPPQYPPRRLGILVFRIPEHDQRAVFLAGEEIERANESHESQRGLAFWMLGVAHAFGHRRAGHAGPEEGGYRLVNGRVRGQNEEVRLGRHQVGHYLVRWPRRGRDEDALLMLMLMLLVLLLLGRLRGRRRTIVDGEGGATVQGSKRYYEGKELRQQHVGRCSCSILEDVVCYV